MQKQQNIIDGCREASGRDPLGISERLRICSGAGGGREGGAGGEAGDDSEVK